MISKWLFNIFVDLCMREMKGQVGNVDTRLKMNRMVWVIVACLSAESEEELQKVLDEYYCTRRKLKVNVVKSKVMVFEWREAEMMDSAISYRASVPAVGR